MPMADNYSEPIWNGDQVKIAAGLITEQGTITTDTPTHQSAGIMQGARYIDSAGIPQWNNWYPEDAGITEVFASIYVPKRGELFQIQMDEAFVAAHRGRQVSIDITDGATTGDGASGWTLDGTADGAGPCKIVDLLDNENATTATPDVLIVYMDDALTWAEKTVAT